MIIYKENSKFLFHRSNLRWPYLDERSLVSYIAGEAAGDPRSAAQGHDRVVSAHAIRMP